MITVLFVSPVGERGGAEAVLLNVLRSIDRGRFRPLAAVLKPGPLMDEIRDLDVGTALVPTGRVRHLCSTARGVATLRRLIRREGVDIVFGNMAMGHLFGALAALGTRTRAVWFQHGVVDRPDLLDALAARLPARRVFVCSDTVRRSQSRTTDYRKIAVISGGIELEHFDPGLIPAGTLRRELGLGPDTLVVACVARLQRWKGQHQLLEAAVRVMASHPEAHFVLVGGGLFGLEPEYEAVLRATARRAPAPGRIHFLGHRDDVPELLTDVDVLVQPTMSPEGLGLSVLEAMAMSIPVVATSLGGCEETVIHGITGYLVPPADVPALSDAIEMLLENAVLRKTMGAEGRRRVLQRFSGERMVREMEGVLERVVDES